jgi:amidophosphoribosyltransferase
LTVLSGNNIKDEYLKNDGSLESRQIVVVSSLAPTKCYPDCYGIDMAKLEGLSSPRAALSLLRKFYIILLMKYMLNVNHRKIL